MGARARQIAEREFGIELQITRILDVYAETLSRRTRPAGGAGDSDPEPAPALPD